MEKMRYIIKSVKGIREEICSLYAAKELANQMNEILQPAFGVQVENVYGETMYDTEEAK